MIKVQLDSMVQYRILVHLCVLLFSCKIYKCVGAISCTLHFFNGIHITCMNCHLLIYMFIPVYCSILLYEMKNTHKKILNLNLKLGYKIFMAFQFDNHFDWGYFYLVAQGNFIIGLLTIQLISIIANFVCFHKLCNSLKMKH